MFAYAAGSNFDSNAKQWRLFADIMNDIGEQPRGCTSLLGVYIEQEVHGGNTTPAIAGWLCALVRYQAALCMVGSSSCGLCSSCLAQAYLAHNLCHSGPLCNPQPQMSLTVV